MFSRKMMEVNEGIEKTMGPDKIYSALLVNGTTHYGSVHEQFIDCIMKSISGDNNHKPWNESDPFKNTYTPKSMEQKGSELSASTDMCSVALLLFIIAMI